MVVYITLLFVVKVSAYDQGQPQKTATAYLVIRVLPADFTGIIFIPPVIRISIQSSE